jgi:2,3-bisphosphoglycerate-independent phosphoglycerate mutase
LQAQHTAAVVNELSSEMQKLLQDHPINDQRRAEGKAPANVVLLRGCGSRIDVPSFEQLHGMKACLVAPTKIIAGKRSICVLSAVVRYIQNLLKSAMCT